MSYQHPTLAPDRPTQPLHATLSPDQSGAPPHQFLINLTDPPLTSLIITIRQPATMGWHPAPSMQEADATTILRYLAAECSSLSFADISVVWQPQPERVRTNQIILRAQGESEPALETLARRFHALFSDFIGQEVADTVAILESRDEVLNMKLARDSRDLLVIVGYQVDPR